MIEKVSASMGPWDNFLFRLRSKLQGQNRVAVDLRSIPVIINNFNRLDSLVQLLNWLEKGGMQNIYIIDNHSTYPPLLSFYKKTEHTVFMLNKNVGFLSLWQTIIFQRFKNRYYIYTDPDIVPVKECPLNAVEYFYSLLQRFPAVDKVGFGLVIDDLPDFYPMKKKVLDWEAQYWQKKVEENLYEAPIDTTFALYRPGVKGGSELNALRTGAPYIARHLTWYLDPLNMPEDEQYYIQHAGPSGSWSAELLGKARNIKY